MTDVFISYKKEDVARVEPIARAFANAGYEVWWDHRIPPGRTYRDVIGAALQTAKCVVVVWSRLSTKAQWVLDEADEGKKRNVLLPLIIDDVDIPYGFRQIEAARLIGWRGDVNDPEWVDALAAVSHLVGRRPGGPPKPFARPSIPPQAHPDNVHRASRQSGGGGAALILGALLVASLAGGGYFAWRSGVFGTQPAAQTTTLTTNTAPPLATTTATTTSVASSPPAHPAPAPSSNAPVTQTPTQQAQTETPSQTPPLPPASAGKPAQPNDDSSASLMTGDFNSTFGAMHLDSNGGTYAYSNGRIRIASASANTLTGTWEQSSSSQRCSDGRYWGRFQMQFTRAGFTGAYGYCDGPTTAGPWNGTRGSAGATSTGAGAQSACASGYVWREASAEDHVCVTPASRLQVRRENHFAAQYVNPNGVYGPTTCISGYVWREAYSGDVVCVTSERRAQVRRENAEAAAHTN